MGIERCTVECLIFRQRRHIVGDDLAQKVFGVRAVDIDNGHMRYVEHASIAAHRRMLFDLRAIIDWHHPTSEVDHFAASRNVCIEKRGFICHVLSPIRSPLILP